MWLLWAEKTNILIYWNNTIGIYSWYIIDIILFILSFRKENVIGAFTMYKHWAQWKFTASMTSAFVRVSSIASECASPALGRNFPHPTMSNNFNDSSSCYLCSSSPELNKKPWLLSSSKQKLVHWISPVLQTYSSHLKRNR